MRVSWTVKKTNEWITVCNKAGVKRWARKTTHGLDGHQYVDRTRRGRVSQNDRGQI